jgi:hypothetical protein
MELTWPYFVYKYSKEGWSVRKSEIRNKFKLDVRYEMWDNKSQERMVNLTSHIPHLSSRICFVLRILNFSGFRR